MASGKVSCCGCNVKNPKWTSSQVSYLKNNYSKKSAIQIGLDINRSPGAVHSKAHELGLVSFALIPKECSVFDCTRLTNESSGGNGMCSKHRQREYRKIPRIKEKYAAYAKNHRRTLKGRLSAARGEATKRNIMFSITLEEYTRMWEESEGKCYYHGGKILHAGGCLDRLDNTLGYTVDNCVLSCSHCNILKADLLSAEETKKVICFLQKLRGTEDIWSREYLESNKRE